MKPDAPSRTAIVVAKSQALVGMSPATAGLVTPDALDFARTALRLSGHDRFGGLLRHRWFRRLVRFYERRMIPGLALHHTLRKQAVERVVRRELSAGATQVVQIGAGFDSLAHRLHREFPQARFIERDHPATHETKRHVIETQGGAAGNLALQAIDLSDPDAAITIPDPSRRTVVIIEGVLMYFDPDTVKRLLRHLGKQLSPDSVLLFSFMESTGFHRQSPLVTWWLRASGEPFRWSLPESDITAFAERLGFPRITLHAAHDNTPGIHQAIARGELLCEARPADRELSTVQCQPGSPFSEAGHRDARPDQHQEIAVTQNR